MPVDRGLADDLARALSDLYSELETDIARVLARRIQHDIEQPADRLSEKLGSVNDLRNAVSRLLVKLEKGLPETVEQQLVLAFERGGMAALDEIGKFGGLTEAQLAAIRASLPGAEAINSLVWSLVSTLAGTHVQVLRWPQDVYRSVIASVLPHGLAGTATRLGIAQRAYSRFLARGVTGFTDKAGRNWQLSSYVEMATRTGLAQAAVQGHLDRLGAAGLELVQVSDSPQECYLCRPWEGKVLHRGVGGGRTVEVEHATRDGEMVKVHVAGSVVEAIAAGLMHPNCRHSFRAYLPGVTKPITDTRDPEGDKARQQQRAIERRIRSAKVEAAGAFTTGAKASAEAKIRAGQRAMREHLAAHPFLKRLSYREQIGAGNIPGPRLAEAEMLSPTDAKKPELPIARNNVADNQNLEVTAAPEASPAPQPASPATAASGPERLAQLLDQQPSDVRKLTGGRTAGVELVTYPDGSQLVRKSNAASWRDDDEQRELTDAEVISAAVLDAVGLRAAAVHRTGPASVAMEWISGQVGAELVADELADVPADILDSPDGRLLGLADFLRGELDRNAGGWIRTADGRIVGVDNGFTELTTNSRFADYLFTDPTAERPAVRPDLFTTDELTALRARLQDLQPLFEQTNRQSWFTAMMTRVDQLEHADDSRQADTPDAVRMERVVRLMTDAELDDAFTSATERDDAELLDAVLSEMDRRQEAEAEAEDPHAQQWAEVDKLVAQGMDDRDAYAQVFGKDADQVRREEAIQRLRDAGNTGRGFDELARSAYRKELQHQYFAAEAATNGFLLTPEGQRKGLDPLDLWRQTEAYARKWASDELKQWWDNNGRLTYDEFSAQLLSGSNEKRFKTGGESWLQ